MSGPAARAVSCPLCNEKFFPASLPFHQKQCEKRRATRIVPCPYCKTEVTQLDLPKHVATCPKAGGGRGKGASHGSRDASPAPRGRGGGGGGGRGGGGGEDRAAGPAQFEPEMLEDGRMRCIYCGRYFTQDRIDKHQDICGKLKSARPKGVDGTPTQTGAKVFDATAQRTGKGTAYVSPEEYKRRQERREREIQKEKEKTQKKSSWRRQHEEFVEACRAGRGEEPPPRPRAETPSHSGKVQCPHCQRYFDPTAAERHIPICANVKNKPRPPPSPTPSRRGAPQSPGRGHPPRPPPHGEASLGSPPVPSRRRAGHPPSGSPKPGSRAASRDPQVELPALSSTMRSTSSHGSMGSSAGFSNGAGMRAARGLKRMDSESKLPGLDTPPRAPASGGGRGHSQTPKGQRSQRVTTQAGGGEPEPDQTILPEQAPLVNAMQTQLDMQRSRLDVQRSAMMCRLLRQVPSEFLMQELRDVGISCDSLDQEGMVQAVVQQLA